jgi:predicted aldo/keto reductase-like oxidoreductase
MRKDVYLVSKNSRGHAIGDAAVKVHETHLDASLERLKTDYVDCYYIHGISGREIGKLRDPGVKAAFENLKKLGKIRFCGLSCHDGRLPEILDRAAEVGWIDQVMFQYTFRFVNHDALQRAIDKASKANLGLVAMKIQKGAESFAKKVAEFQEKGFKREGAAIKSVFSDQRMQVVVSEMTNFDQLKENMTAAQDQLTPKEARLLEEHRRATANMFCHGCGHLCETAAEGVPVAIVLRYLRYDEAYGKRHEARALYQALPPAARAIAETDLTAVDAACPFGLPVADLLRTADRRLS